MSVSPYDTLRRRAAERIGEMDLDPLRDGERIRAEVDRLVSDYQRPTRATASGPSATPTTWWAGSSIPWSATDRSLRSSTAATSKRSSSRASGLRSSIPPDRLQALDAPTSEEENRQIVARILAGTNRRIDTSNPIEQARVLGGQARLTAVIPPVADRLSVTLRKYTVKNYDLGFLVDGEVLTAPAASFLWAAAQANTTVLFSGQPGAGKTTILSAYLRAAPTDRCIRVCEEVRELDLPLMHGSFYEASPPTLDGRRRYTLRDLVKVVLAQRPDLICVGEVRGSEAFELTRAVNAGCGFACTIHADSASAALMALVNAALMAGENVTEAIVSRVFRSAIDFVVHLRRDQQIGEQEGIRRRVVEIASVSPERRGNEYLIETLFHREGLGGPLRWTGAMPRPEAVERIEWALPEGVRLEPILSGAWKPHL